MPSVSPLRYPGGKGKLARFLSDTLELNQIRDGIYVEPYAGGAGAALNLLLTESCSRIIINDIDPCLSAFWTTILTKKNLFISRLLNTNATIIEWRHQRNIYLKHEQHSTIKVALATFFLNRCNRSGIISTGGPIGGINQCGPWRIDARFNKRQLIRRIEKIH